MEIKVSGCTSYKAEPRRLGVEMKPSRSKDAENEDCVWRLMAHHLHSL